MQIDEYPRPQRDNGRGIHWFPTLSQDPGVIDRFVSELHQMRIRWVLIMSGMAQWARFANDYLVNKLVGPDRSKPQIMPIMRIYAAVTEPLNQNVLREVVAHYVARGVSYFQLYNEPNLSVEWGTGIVPGNPAKELLDAWIPAADTVLAAGGLPSVPPLAPYGNYDDMHLFREVFEEINRRGRQDLYQKLWVCIHNYTLGRPLDYNDDSRGFRMFLHYNKIVKGLVGRPLPQLSGEAGLRLGPPPYGDTMDESFVSRQTVNAYERMAERVPDYYFCFSPWLIGNEVGGGHDPTWESASWFRKDGTRQMVVDAVKAMPDRIRKPVAPPPTERFFEETQHWVREPFLSFYSQYGSAVCGLPITEQLTENGVPTQYFRKTAVEEHETGKVRFKRIGEELLRLRDEVKRLQSSTPSPVTLRPEIQDIADELPKHPTVPPYGTRPLSQIKLLVIHHSASKPTTTPLQIANYHVWGKSRYKKEWPGIGYHFVITNEGKIYQTQKLETVSFHATSKGNPIGVGINFVGDFTEVFPPEAQMTSGARLVAYLLQELELSIESIIGHKEIVATQCPGNQWLTGKKWKNLLLQDVQAVIEAAQHPPEKPIKHYVLFYSHDEAWGKEDYQGAFNFIARFRPTHGFSVEDAMRAEYVTIIGGPLGISHEEARRLRQSGCKVRRIAGANPEETKQELDEIAATGNEFHGF
jgi:hypothetical protein